jgi:hypothetical protein
MKLNGHWNFMSATTWKTPGFETNDLGYMRTADQILSVLWAGYNQWEPKWIYRNYNINFDIFSVWDFGGNNLSKGLELNSYMKFKNYWDAWTGGSFQLSELDPSMLRGGPMMKTPGSYNMRFGFETDDRKKLGFETFINSSTGLEKSSTRLYTEIEVSYKPTDYLQISFNPGFSKQFNELQYVTSMTINNDEKFIFASIDRKTISTSFRINLNLNPELTIQYWGQPFLATGKYYDHKLITDPIAGNYNNRFLTYTDGQINRAGEDYNVDENIDGITDYSFERRDFNIQEFLSNMVIRWEYNPGSSVYLVWSQIRESSNDSGHLDLFNDMKELFDPDDNKPHNVFLIKFSYRFGLK